MRAAAVQLNSREDKAGNLAVADRLTRAAAADGASLVVLPEKFNVLGTHDDYLAGAEPLDGPTIEWARELARELGIDFVPGSIVERRDDRDKLSNTSVHVGPDGEVKAVYRKIHMFDVEVGGQVYRESETQEGGHEIVQSQHRRRRGPRPDRLLRPALPRALPHPRGRGRARAARPGGLHRGHRPRALGDPDPRPRDREPGLRGRGRPGRARTRRTR